MLGMLQRQWGIAAARSNAALLLDRLGYVGRSVHAAAGRRARVHAFRTRFVHQRAITRSCHLRD
eukprot:3017751-Karenia_brevis.AAC.1